MASVALSRSVAAESHHKSRDQLKKRSTNGGGTPLAAHLERDDEVYTYKAKIDRVIDGDTIDLVVDLGFHVHLKERFRLLGIDAPEMTGETRDQGIQSKFAVVDWFRLHPSFIVSTQRDAKEKYGRWLCEVFDEATHGSLTAWLVESGYAVPAQF